MSKFIPTFHEKMALLKCARMLPDAAGGAWFMASMEFLCEAGYANRDHSLTAKGKEVVKELRADKAFWEEYRTRKPGV